MLKKIDGKWAFASRKTGKALAYYDGEGKPSDEWVASQERRVQYFKHMGEEVKSDILPKSGAGAWGTDTLVKSYIKDTPGQSIKSFKTYIKESSNRYTGSNGFYAWVNPTNETLEELLDFFPELKLTAEEVVDLHVTIMYSKTAIPVECASKVEPSFSAPVFATHIEFWEGHDKDGYLVLKLTRDSIERLHNKWKACGAVSTFDDYVPHMTLKTPFKKDQKLIDHLNEKLSTKRLQINLIQEQIQDLKK